MVCVETKAPVSGWEGPFWAKDVPRYLARVWHHRPSPSITCQAIFFHPDDYREEWARLRLDALALLRQVTASGEQIWAIADEDEGNDFYRFWPHAAEPGAAWPCSSLGHDRYAPADLSWQLGVDRDLITISGRRLVEAFRRHPPQSRLLSNITEVDGERVDSIPGWTAPDTDDVGLARTEEGFFLYTWENRSKGSRAVRGAMPTPSMVCEGRAALRNNDPDSVERRRSQQDEFAAVAEEVVRSLTARDEFVFALSWQSSYRDYRFWPHRVEAGVPWPLRIGLDCYSLVERDCSWGS
jgi:hypothetical protein